MTSRDQFYDDKYLHEIEVVDEDNWYFVYRQSTGEIYVSSHVLGLDNVYHNRNVIGTGYSGRGDGYLNNPAAEHLVGKGPIPRGIWGIGVPQNHPRLGPHSIPLWPENGWEVPGGRSGFFIHGDNKAANKTASSGCIVLPRRLREFISGARCKSLYVVQ